MQTQDTPRLHPFGGAAWMYNRRVQTWKRLSIHKNERLFREEEEALGVIMSTNWNLSAFLFANQELLFQLKSRIESKTRTIPTIFIIVILSEKANTPIIVATTNSIDATTGTLPVSVIFESPLK